jgi:hypothetical protein
MVFKGRIAREMRRPRLTVVSGIPDADAAERRVSGWGECRVGSEADPRVGRGGEPRVGQSGWTIVGYADAPLKRGIRTPKVIVYAC